MRRRVLVAPSPWRPYQQVTANVPPLQWIRSIDNNSQVVINGRHLGLYSRSVSPTHRHHLARFLPLTPPHPPSTPFTGPLRLRHTDLVRPHTAFLFNTISLEHTPLPNHPSMSKTPALCHTLPLSPNILHYLFLIRSNPLSLSLSQILAHSQPLPLSLSQTQPHTAISPTLTNISLLSNTPLIYPPPPFRTNAPLMHSLPFNHFLSFKHSLTLSNTLFPLYNNPSLSLVLGFETLSPAHENKIITRKTIKTTRDLWPYVQHRFNT